MKSNKAFTLIELLVVVLIIGILAAIAVPKYQVAVLKSKLARAKQSVSDIRKAYELYHLQHGVYPTKFSDLDFANKFDDNSLINMDDGFCRISDAWHEIICNIDNKIEYYVNFYTADPNNITTKCSAISLDTSDIYNKICQQDTAKTSGYCWDGYCSYKY